MQMSIIMSNMLMSNVAYMWFWRQVGGRLQWQQLALFLTTSSMSKASASESSKCEQPIINHVSFKWRTITDKFLTRSTAYLHAGFSISFVAEHSNIYIKVRTS